jgi:hypothetical protein
MNKSKIAILTVVLIGLCGAAVGQTAVPRDEAQSIQTIQAAAVGGLQQENIRRLRVSRH